MKKDLAIAAVLVVLQLGCSRCDDSDGSGTAARGGGGTAERDEAGEADAATSNADWSLFCPDNGVSTNQIQISNAERVAEVANCISFKSLTIWKGVDNVDALNKITTIEDYLLVNFSSISDLQGLSGLTSVGGNVTVKNCSALTNLDGLSNLKTIGGRLELRYNPVLSDLRGLDGLTSVGDDVIIIDCSALTNLDGLSNLKTIGGGALFIQYNESLPTCDAQTLAARLNVDKAVICENKSDSCGWRSCLEE